MKIQITDSTFFVWNKLMLFSEGHVHSVYRKTVNIQFGDQLFALQCAGSPISPVSLICELTSSQLESLPIHTEDRVSVSAGTLTIHTSSNQEFHFSLSECNKIHTFLDVHLSVLQQAELLHSLNKILSSGTCDGLARILCPFPDTDVPLYLPVAKKNISSSLSAFQAGLWNESAALLGKMIGLGIGLTPCGDDFLCGVLAALVLCGKEKHPFTVELENYIHSHLKDTNDISSAFLNCALQHHFSQAVQTLSSGATSQQIQTMFEQIGHSSGMDTLCGIAYVLKLQF